MRLSFRFLFVLFVFAILVVGCTEAEVTQPEPTSTPEISYTPQEIADAIVADDVGIILEVADNGSDVPIFIFHELHSSVLGQVELAVMFNRLYRDFGTTHIALEGAFDTIEAPWFEAFPGTSQEQAPTIVRAFAEGEINNAEFMVLARSDIAVVGIEDEAQYLANELAFEESNNASLMYLIYFASESMSEADIEEADRVFDEEGVDAYIEFFMQFDDWAAEHYPPFSGDSIVPVEELVIAVDEIAEQAEERGYNAVSDFDEYATGLQHERDAYQLAADRSVTMVERTLAMTEETNGPIPMIIGAAHTAGITDMFDEAGQSYVLIEAASFQAALTEEEPIGDLSYFAYNRKGALQSIDGPGLLGAFLDDRGWLEEIKPRPFLNEIIFQRKVATYFVSRSMVAWLAAQDPLPDLSVQPLPDELTNMLDEFDSLNVFVNRDTLEIVEANPEDPEDTRSAIVFEVTLPAVENEHGKAEAVTFWAKVAQQEGFDNEQLAAFEAAEDVFEWLLLNERALMLEEGESDERLISPGDDEVIPSPAVRISHDTVGTFGSSRDVVVRRGI